MSTRGLIRIIEPHWNSGFYCAAQICQPHDAYPGPENNGLVPLLKASVEHAGRREAATGVQLAAFIAAALVNSGRIPWILAPDEDCEDIQYLYEVRFESSRWAIRHASVDEPKVWIAEAT